MTRKIGLDIGSTTAKIVMLDEGGSIQFSRYRRHNAKIGETVFELLEEMKSEIGDVPCSMAITGSIGMGVAQRAGIQFVQEVVAACKAVQGEESMKNRHVRSMVDIGGEDAKVVFFNLEGEAETLRMNGNCAAGTGAFIDQMSAILGVTNNDLDTLASQAEHIHPIASRCGVFCKTDIQNLIAKNVPKNDIAASIFHAIAVQTVVTLAHGYEIEPPLLLCGGPLTYLSSLRREFMDYLHLSEDDIISPENGSLIPATGTAIACDGLNEMTITQFEEKIQNSLAGGGKPESLLPPVFNGEEDHQNWLKALSGESIGRTEIKPFAKDQKFFLGIDSGSTTTKVVFTDPKGNIAYSFYSENNGDPIGTAAKGIQGFEDMCKAAGTEAVVVSGCSTGYGEDLLKAAFGLDNGIVETIAHYLAAKRMDPEVSFILDIGGQDMKAIYVDNGVIHRIEINEACSSGCGSFISTFAKSLGYTSAQFAALACTSQSPCDLGTRCTVFMNSKVKQALREGYEVQDIAAGLAYSVVRNCLYKVLNLSNTASLGNHIVVQGGTMKNDAVVKALENMSGAKVSRSDCPELMGAYGCCLYAIANSRRGSSEIESIDKEEELWKAAV